MFYNGRQMIEERDDPYSPTTVAQNVWSLAYTDALVLRDTDADLSTASGSYGKTSSGLEVRQYVLQDANWNVTGIVNTSGNVIERYKYDPYGAVTVLNGASDHDAGVSDWSADADNTSDWKWVYYFQGLWWDGDAKLLRADYRDLNVNLGRWMQEDPNPAGAYADGMNWYQYVGSNPVNHLDPSGLRGRGVLSFKISKPKLQERFYSESKWYWLHRDYFTDRLWEFGVEAKFDPDDAPCLEFRQEIKGYALDGTTKIAPPRANSGMFASFVEDTQNTDKTSNPHYGHRNEPLNLEGDQYSPARIDGATYEMGDLPGIKRIKREDKARKMEIHLTFREKIIDNRTGNDVRVRTFSIDDVFWVGGPMGGYQPDPNNNGHFPYGTPIGGY
jgi:RHS repeat-associated protein